MTTAVSVKAAEERARLAREKLQDTANALQSRVQPAALARQAIDGITEGGERALQTGVTAARENPGIAAGAGALAFLLMVRRPLTRLLRGRKRPEKITDAYHGATPRRIDA